MAQKVNYNLIIVAGLLVGGYFAFGNDILKALGIKKTAEDKKTDENLNIQEKKYNFWGGIANMKIAIGPKKNMVLLTVADSQILAKRINNAFGTFNDDEDAIFGVFRGIRYQSQVSSLVDAYRTAYKADLLTTLKGNLSDAELAELLNIVSIKPTGITNLK
jgi:hypothetical protein